MKNENVMIGGTYLTKIGESLARVVVVQRRIGVSYRGGRKERDSYDVRRANSDRVLPSPRTAAALREIRSFAEQALENDARACGGCNSGECPRHPLTGNEAQA